MSSDLSASQQLREMRLSGELIGSPLSGSPRFSSITSRLPSAGKKKQAVTPNVEKLSAQKLSSEKKLKAVKKRNSRSGTAKLFPGTVTPPASPTTGSMTPVLPLPSSPYSVPRSEGKAKGMTRMQKRLASKKEEVILNELDNAVRAVESNNDVPDVVFSLLPP